MEYNEGVEIIRKKITMNKLVKCSAAAILAASLFSMSGQSVNAATGYQRLTHNAYAYTYSGKRANNKLYKKGSKVKVIGSITLNGKKYNIISGNVYIKASNFAKRRSSTLGGGYETQLLHNSYVYNAKGQRIKGKKLLKNHSVTCYGNPIRIHGKKYIQVGKGQFVRLSNVLYSYDGPTGSDSLNHTHHNASSNTSNTTKRNSSNNSSNSTTSNGSNSSSQSNSSSSSSNTTNGSSTTSKSTSGSSTTDKKDSNKPDTNKKDQSKPDSKTPSKSGDNKGNKPSDSKNTGKNSSKADTSLATDADYVALYEAMQKAVNPASREYATLTKREAFDEAYQKASNYLHAYQFNDPTPTATVSDIKKAISDLNTTLNNLNGTIIENEMPRVSIEVLPNNTRKILWANDQQKQKVLDIANQIYGSKDARFVKLTDDSEIVLTNCFGVKNCIISANDLVKARYIYDN